MPSLTEAFFTRDPVTCSRELIGCHFHWHGAAGIIVETEAYDSADDPACHTWFRPSTRAFVESHPAGTAYVYLNYGVHWLFNILVKGPHRSGFVLFRALEPVSGIDAMRQRRPKIRHTHQLASGPGKLTRALGIDGSAHGTRILLAPHCRIAPSAPPATVTGPPAGRPARRAPAPGRPRSGG
ncbi:MAG: DNA-3-methyladenine glycosylase, partial [Verrucomicrobiales bacterium]